MMTLGHCCTSHETNKADMRERFRHNTARSHKCGMDCYGIITCDVELLIKDL